MQDYAIEFANELKKRDNIDPDETVIGKVININPVTISIYNETVLLTENKNLYVSKNLGIATGTAIVNGETGTSSIDNSLKIGDRVACIPTNKGQSYIATVKV
ncbi:hypothetical protein BCM19_000410 [Clostridium beijerinckii]|uniref:DUF2577 family protein n=1 Tax=Clostridium beijerinckii TaxID=1520 RepID=UPI00156D41C2|nr:DUF2577 family protein [Clostridium beijerinckii]NRT32445.1 hypothetical protein [Clostridium beijerinckii]